MPPRRQYMTPKRKAQESDSNSKAKPLYSGPAVAATPRRKESMPSLTLDTSPNSKGKTPSDTDSRPESPPHPPFSPITPTLATARLATNFGNAPQGSTQYRQSYTHSQAPQIAVPPPALEPIDFNNNPDVLALKANISILQIQRARAEADIQTLQRTKEKALTNPEEFARALQAGEIKTASDPLFHPEQEDDDEDGEATCQLAIGKKGKYEKLPGPQNVVRMPSINWAQYAVVGDSLNKLHEDQLARPTDGVPQRVGPDGHLIPGGEGTRRPADFGIGAPYQPSKDKIEKMSTRKGGKR